MGIFITLEGGDGTGKTTQAHLLSDALRDVGRQVVTLREPGGTPLGDYLRKWLQNSKRPTSAESELLLFTAARAELVASVLTPALKAGRDVVLDRYADSTTVYQGYGRLLSMQAVRTANKLATKGLTPDLTILLDAPPEAALSRAFSREGQSANERFEGIEVAFHRRVRQGFLRLAKREPQRWYVVDSLQSIDTIHAQIWDHVHSLLPKH